ncbi:hypothetical protein EDD85DRAFT_244384 [Armillaria nabsnona]|nr:hypothetical protein EDD85DRAFT_244384 [Armillaria nabsnona]
MSCLAMHTLYSPSGRWLYNNAEWRAAIYMPFNVNARQEIGCRFVDAGYCTALPFTTTAEGSCNKIFLLKFGNASRAIGRIPSSIVRNTHLSTCSKVATMQFVREELEIQLAK